MGTQAGTLWGWALQQGHSGVGHSKDTLNLGTSGTTAGIYSGIGHSRHILGLGTAGITPRILWGWALILKGWVSELGAARPGRDRARSSGSYDLIFYDLQWSNITSYNII